MRSRLTLATVAAGGLTVAAIPAAAHQAAPTRAPVAHAAAAHTVKFGEYFYRPKKLTIRAGESVRFVNVGKVEHTVADSSKSGNIRSRLIKPRPLKHGASQTVKLTRRGTVYYLCTFHPALMRGVIVVR
jgi:plastocyanin